MAKRARELIPPGLVQIADNITSRQNILGAPRGAGARWAKDLNLPKESETIFFAGCGYQYTSGLESMLSFIRKMDKSLIGAELPTGLAGLSKKMGVDLAGAYRKLAVRDSDTDGQPLRDAVRVLKSLGIEFGYLADDEPCCGGPLHHIGLEAEFKSHATGIYQKLKSFGVRRIISIVPSCTYTLRNLIPNYVDGFDLEVKHFIEVVSGQIEPDRFRFPRQVRVVYHDPCQLSRYLGLIDEPRQVLRKIKGIELLDTDLTSGEWSTCCGGGGGFEAVFPELSQILAANRVKELISTEAEIIVTHCPGCVMQLEAGLKELGKSDVEVLDLTQILAMAIEG